MEGYTSRFFRWALTMTLMVYPVLALLTRAGSAVCFYVLFLLSLCLIVREKKQAGMTFIQFIKKYLILHLSMVGLFVATALSELYWRDFQPQQFYFALRLAAFPVLVWGMMFLPPKDISRIQWGIVAGVIVCGVYYFIYSQGGTLRQPGVGKMALIPFADLSLLMGFLAFLTIGWNSGKSRVAISLKVIALVAGLSVSFLSATRGGWIAIPFFMLATAGLFWVQGKKKLIVIVGMTVLIVLMAMFANGTITKRITHFQSDMASYLEGQVNTSSGLRFQLWKGSWLMFKESPVLGVGGRDSFLDKLEKYAHDGLVHPVTPKLYHAHNDLFFQMAMHGILGLASLLMIYIFPIWKAICFVRDKPDDIKLRTTAFMLITLIGGFFIFGLTEVFFGITKDVGNFFLIFIAVFFAFLIRYIHELKMKN